MKSTSRWARRTLLAFLLPPLVLGMGFDERTFECENAAAHLEECCPGFAAAPSLCPQAFGCGGEPLFELSNAESECIKGLDCGDVRSRGVCGKVSDLVAQGKRRPSTGSSSGADRVSVCP
jgi:hypothetical protein